MTENKNKFYSNMESRHCREFPSNRWDDSFFAGNLFVIEQSLYNRCLKNQDAHWLETHTHTHTPTHSWCMGKQLWLQSLSSKTAVFRLYTFISWTEDKLCLPLARCLVSLSPEVTALPRQSALEAIRTNRIVFFLFTSVKRSRVEMQVISQNMASHTP